MTKAPLANFRRVKAHRGESNIARLSFMLGSIREPSCGQGRGVVEVVVGHACCALRWGSPSRGSGRVSALSGAPFWPWCLWRLCGAVPGATGTLVDNARVGGRLDAWRAGGAVVLDLLVSL